jgi:sigma-B regulation protein RsbU (phosphoserine phosphatase)
MRLKIRNDLEEMARLREAVLEFAGENSLSEDIVFTLDLCLEELVTNVIFYGYEDQNEHSIEVNLKLEGGILILQIIDDGKEFDPTHLPVPNLDIPLEERQIGGLGVHLVRNYVDSMEYKREDAHNILTIRKKV